MPPARSHYADRALAAAAPKIEDEIDAAIAAWKTVYGEDIGYNEHAVTLEYLGSLHRTNDLTSDQLADCADSVEWITWALAQPEQSAMLKNVGGPPVAARRILDEPSTITTRSDTVREGMRRGGHRTLEQIVRLLADLETRAADVLADAETGKLPVADAHKYIDAITPVVEDLQQRRETLLFDQAHYAKDGARFTAMARPSGYVIEDDERMDIETFERLRAKHRYCDDSHTQRQAFTDTIPDNSNEGW